MLHVIENVVPLEIIKQIRTMLESHNADWQDGKQTAGASAKNQKDNLQLARSSPNYEKIAEVCLKALKQHPVFMSAALPKMILPPLFSCYENGQHYGNHVDNAILPHPITNEPLRSDLSLTLFLSDPDSYEGGELIVEDSFGSHQIKLAAGDAILYPATSLHRVNAVTSGKRLALVTWIQSLVRSHEQRQILHDLDISHILLRQKLQSMGAMESVAREIEALNKSYHNLLRLWADC
ncbi:MULTISPECIES: Fe2+-dependent dioxygenase [Psychrobacter]|uniref:Fe2+-dependent dioxygenase n=1 Tax=Psychrobacter TaxID=497 RepID=UPI00146C66E8|nr:MULTISPECIES: Fe2+-dependent dioxygenase [Psychrobacter]